MQCPSCGKTIPDDSTFCNHCGQPVIVSAPESQESVPVNCARCGGSGKISGWFGASTCPACHGKGKVQVAPPARKCPLCNGTGFQEGFVNKPLCGVCWGTGWADVVR